MTLRRRTAVIWAIAAGAIILGTGAQTWIESSQITGLPGTEVTTTGNQAAAVVPAMALVGMASGIALSMARRLGRVVTSVLLILSGAATAWASAQAALEPAAAASAQVSAASGITADAGSYAVTLWPWLTLAAGVLLALCGVAVLLFARGWQDSRRYDTAGNAPRSAGSQGTGGSDRHGSDGHGSDGHGSGGPASGARGRPTGEPAVVDEIDAWDDLSRGDDPT